MHRRIFNPFRNIINYMRIRNTAEWFGGNYVSETRPILIGGCARSGTTLLRVMLDSHRSLCGGPESWLFVLSKINLRDLSQQFEIPLSDLTNIYHRAGSRTEFIDLFFAEYSRLKEKERWVDKTPKNITRLPLIFRAFPNVKFIHMIRDGRDVVCSLMPKKGVSAEAAITRWVSDIEASRPYWSDPRLLEIRYEALVFDPKETLEKILDFVEEPWDDNVLRYYQIPRDVSKLSGNPGTKKPLDTSSVGRWKQDLSQEERQIVKEIGGYLLREFGYTSSDDW